MIKDPPTAFPWTHGDVTCTGMTMRDYFAAKSITWFLTALENEGMVDEPALLRQFAAESAYRMADAMMKARGA
jgi:hypothetical protein